MGCGCGGRKFSGTRGTVATRSPVSQHAPARQVAAPPRGLQQPSSAPSHIVQSTSLATRRANVTRRQV